MTFIHGYVKKTGSIFVNQTYGCIGDNPIPVYTVAPIDAKRNGFGISRQSRMDIYSPLDETAIWLQPICLSDPSGEGCDDRIKKRNLIQFEV
jgi:hypothetical protein